MRICRGEEIVKGRHGDKVWSRDFKEIWLTALIPMIKLLNNPFALHLRPGYLIRFKNASYLQACSESFHTKPTPSGSCQALNQRIKIRHDVEEK